MAPSWPLIKDLLFLRERLNRLLEEAPMVGTAGVGEPSSGPFCPAADLYETDNEVVVILEVPGVDLGSVDLRLQGDTLRVSGRVRPSEAEEPSRYLRMERGHGAFYRDFRLPEGALQGSPRAELERGVLTVRVEKHGRDRARRLIKVKEDV